KTKAEGIRLKEGININLGLLALGNVIRARKIKNKPIVHIDPQMAELNSLRQQVQELKAHIYHLTGGTGVHPTPQKAQENSAELDNIKEENERLRIENKSLLVELQRITISNRTTYERYMQLETERDDQKQKFEEIKLAFQKLMREREENTANLTQQSNLDQTVSQNKTLFDELQSKMQEFEQIKKQSSEIETEPEVSDLNEPMEKDYALLLLGIIY
ncbi:chromosome-associated kinesin KIF4A, partial [Brachionus plicatilis]